MKYAWFWGESSRAAISTASCSDPTGVLEKNSQVGCDSLSDERVAGEGWLAIVELSEEGVYVVMAVEVASVVVAAVVVAAVEAAAGVEWSLVAAVVVVKEASRSMASLSTAAMSLIDVNDMSVVGYV